MKDSTIQCKLKDAYGITKADNIYDRFKKIYDKKHLSDLISAVECHSRKGIDEYYTYRTKCLSRYVKLYYKV